MNEITIRAIVDADDLKRLLQADETSIAWPTSRLAVSEEEAAALLGLEKHVLRDARKRGAISFSRPGGRSVRYTRTDLLAFLDTTHVPAKLTNLAAHNSRRRTSDQIVRTKESGQ